MNRETKRAIARQQRASDPAARLQQLRRPPTQRQQVRTAPRRRGFGAAGGFGSEVIAELRKVNWPDRRTVVSYTGVVLVAVSVMMALIFGFDTLFGQAVLALFGRGD